MEMSVNEKLALFCVFTDQSKVFDKKQFWSVEMTMNRFGFPKKFQKFYLLYIMNCVSYVKTKFGFTKPIVLENSLKQGDPMSGLMYIMCDEPLHMGYRKNPLNKNTKINQGFITPKGKKNKSTRICR